MNISREEQLYIIEKHDDINYVDIPEDLAAIMKETGSYRIDADFFTKMNTMLCHCGTSFNQYDYEACPICNNTKFKIQKIDEKAYDDFIENGTPLKLKSMKFGNKFFFEEIKDNKSIVYTNNQSFTYNWFTKEITIEDSTEKVYYGELILEGENLYFKNKKEQIINIYKFISLVNDSSLIDFIKVYNAFFPSKPLPILDKNRKVEIKRMIASHNARIMTEYFNTYGYYFDKTNFLTSEKIKDYELKNIHSKEMLIHPSEINQNIYKMLNIPKSMLKKLKEYFDEMSKNNNRFKDLSIDSKSRMIYMIAKYLNEYELKTDVMIKLFDLLIVPQKSHFSTYTTDNMFDNIKTLVDEHNHNLKDLIRYIEVELVNKQKLPVDEGIKIYYDYVNMSSLMGVVYNKYHKSIEKAHDIRAKDFKIVKDKASDKLMEKVYKDNPIKVNEVNDFVFIQPKGVKDLVDEGQVLHHCVASYTDKVINGKSLIYFMRNKNETNKRLVTIELYKGKEVVQCRGNYNRKVNEEEKKSIVNWAKNNHFNISPYAL